MTLTTETSQKIPGFLVAKSAYGLWWPAPCVIPESSKSGICGAEMNRRRPEKMPPTIDNDPWHGIVPEQWTLQNYRDPVQHEYKTIARARNWQSVDIKRPWTLCFFVVITSTYGGLHCLAWNSMFPSFTQQFLWRITSIGVMSMGFLILVCCRLLEVVKYRCDCDLQYAFGRRSIFDTPRWRILLFSSSRPVLGSRLRHLLEKWFTESEDTSYTSSLTEESQSFGSESRTNVNTGDNSVLENLPTSRDLAETKRTGLERLGIGAIHWFGKSIDNLLRQTFNLAWVFYAFARIYLVVECFIQLFHLPPGPVFEQASWPVYAPHFG